MPCAAPRRRRRRAGSAALSRLRRVELRQLGVERPQRLRPQPVRRARPPPWRCVPRARAAPASFARLATSSASLVLPTPLSPLTRKRRPRPGGGVVERGRELLELAVASDEDAGRAPPGPVPRRAPRSSDGSWRRIACSSSCSCRPGSIPSSSTSARRASRYACSASAWRPAAVQREHQLRRAAARGADSARRAPRAPPRARRARRAARSASIRPRARPRGAPRAAPISAGRTARPRTPRAACPRQSASASASAARAPAASDAASRLRPVGRELLEPRQVEVVGVRRASEVAAGPRLHDVLGRERAAQPRDVDLQRFRRVGGRPVAPQRARSAAAGSTTSFACRSRSASSARCLLPPSSIGPASPSTSSGPRMRNSTLGDVAVAWPACNRSETAPQASARQVGKSTAKDGRNERKKR